MSNPRRTFLKVLAAAPLAACSGNSGDPAPFGVVAAGSVSVMKVGELTLLANAPAVLARDEAGLYAMTITCTHAGCDVTPQGSTLFCPCHSSLFDSNGGVLRGPAGAPLVHFAVSIDAMGNVTVDGNKQVAASVRTVVPTLNG